MVDILRADYRSIKIAAKALLDGEVIAFPTETVYGIGVSYGNSKGIEKLRLMKGRDADKPFQILIPNISYVARYANCDNEKTEALMHAFWPGAMTLVLPDINGETCGLRIPDNKWLRVLMLEIGCGIIATSANISGEKPATNAEEIDEALGIDLGLIIDGNNTVLGEGSSVVGIDKDGELEIFRQGAIKAEALKAVYYGE